MSTYVLVHGAWSGAHTFRMIRSALRDAGHDLFTPSLTGLGERAHLASPQVDLSLHVQDVVNVVVYEDLSDIVLLGYSYGGMVVTGAVDHIGDRVRHLVYLDAFVPADGQSLYGMTEQSAPGATDIGQSWLVQPPIRQYDDPQAADWWDPRRSPHPIGCFTEPVRLGTPLEEHPFTRTYVKATGEPRPAGNKAFWAAGDHAKDSPHWRYEEIDTNHMIPQNRPAELSALLLGLA